MTFLLHGATLALTWFLLVNAAASVLAWWAERRAACVDPDALFALRVFPAAAGLAFAAALFVPSHWRYEPRQSMEGFDITLVAASLVALAVAAASFVRTAIAWTRVSRRTRQWMRHARPLAFADPSVDAFEVDSAQPVMALAGVVRPRLLVTSGLVDALSPEELAASVAHEIGHRRAWDNLKRLLMCAAPDALAFTGAGAAIERRWASAAEQAADRMCGDGCLASRCALASALVKVARLTPPEPSLSEPISTLIGGGDIVSRVERLLADEPAAHANPARRRVLFVAAVSCAAAFATYGPLLRAVHIASEALVRLLP